LLPCERSVFITRREPSTTRPEMRDSHLPRRRLDGVLALLEALPRFSGGDALFSTTGGAKPINGYFKAKARLDAAMRAELGRPPAPWVNHDIRRTVRTRLSELRVPEPVVERVIGHAVKGLAASTINTAMRARCARRWTLGKSG
jgi:hypothetical protein